MEMIKWINSTGGPIVILPMSEMKKWSGCYSVKSIAAEKIIETEDFLNPDESDYGKACQVYDYIETIDFQKGKAIVLGDVPLSTTFIKDENNEILIVRWFLLKMKKK